MTPLTTGGLWRDVVNFAGPSPTPGIYLPLLDAVSPRWSGWTYFMGMMADVLRTSENRLEIEQEVESAVIGHRLWTEHRDAITSWAHASTRHPMTNEEIEDWWFGGERQVLIVEEHTHLRGFLKRVPITPAERRRVDAMIASGDKPLLVYRLREHLDWIGQLGGLYEVAQKTWPADPSQRDGWTQDDLEFINAYYQEQSPSLHAEEKDGTYDPTSLESISFEASMGMGGSVALSYRMYVLMRAAVIDFVDELLETTRLPTTRGSMRCVDCGVFVGRRALGYGQLYCGTTCKKRAAKRRYRARSSAAPRQIEAAS
ncbi:MAG: hypothetical protein ABJC24_00290 [Chloroflexota bacterium]